VIGLAAPALRPLVPPSSPRGRPCRAGPDNPCAPLRLHDGRRLDVRPLGPHDADAEQAFVSTLSRQSRYRRFHAGMPALPPSLLAQLVDVDQLQHVALAARPLGQQRIVADARFVRDADDPARAEFAIAVADDWQGLGLGRQLLLRLARQAQAQGVSHLRGDVLWDNRPMIGLVERLGGTLQRRGDEPGVLLASFRSAALSA
jgi:acetyltransferase